MSLKLGDILMGINPCDIRTKRLIFCPPTDENAVHYVEIAADTAWRRREQFHPLVDWGVTPETRISRSVMRNNLTLPFANGRLKVSLQARMPHLRAPPAKGRRFEQYATAGGEHDEYAVGR